MDNKLMEDKLTILINSCDEYEDLWFPFFTLMKKYWNPSGIRIILNTETKDFVFEGLEIECVHCPGEKRYGKRMIHALNQVKTEYVLSLLDDFFIRSEVDETRIEQIICWMEEDPDIVSFNCDPNTVYADWEIDKHPGFRRLPPGNAYILSMQAAVWRTKKLLNYWMPNVSPWEWEELCTVRTTLLPEDKFYCVVNAEYSFIQYGHMRYGNVWGVYRGKWIAEDVVPLFEKEHISVDFSSRGFYDTIEKKNLIDTPKNCRDYCKCVARCLGKRQVLSYLLFCCYCRMMKVLGLEIESDYFRYLQVRARGKFLKNIVRNCDGM